MVRGVACEIDEQVNLVLDGSVGKLGLALKAKGPVGANLKGSLAALDPDLPFDLALDWKSLSWPLHKPAKDEPSYRLDKGTLSAKGKLSELLKSQGPLKEELEHVELEWMSLSEELETMEQAFFA
jgi:autotransporter translocation and assembly factor TamB